MLLEPNNIYNNNNNNNNKEEGSLKNSISLQLINKIFKLYLLLAITMTLAQFYFEFIETQRSNRIKLKEIGQTFSGALSDGLFTMDDNVLDAVLKGIQGNSIVVGVELFNEKGNKVKKLGIGNEKQIKTKSDNLLSRTFMEQFELKLTPKGKKLGQVILYSQNLIIFEQLKYGFILMLLNAFLKTGILWLIIIFSIKKILSMPLDKLSEEVKVIDSDNLKEIDIKYSYNNELTLLKDTINKLINRVLNSQKKINDQFLQLESYKSSLEEKVKERTLELSKVNEQFIIAAHRAGMAESAIGVLHNIGNALSNAVVTVENLRTFVEEGNLFKRISQVNQTFQDHEDNLINFFTNDELGKKYPKILTVMFPKIIEFQAFLKSDIEILNNVLAFLITSIDEQRKLVKIEINPEPFDLAQALQDSLLVYEPRFRKYHIKIENKVESNLIITLQKNKFLQILQNMLSNSIDALAEVDGMREIILFSEKAQNSIKIFIQDNGPGIKKEVLENIFNFGFTTKKEGSGIGLYSSSNLMEELKGKLELIESKPGYTLFCLVFNLKD